MFQKIVVPLDGSELAECALPYAEDMAKSCDNAEVILVTVTEVVSGQTSIPGIKLSQRSAASELLSGTSPSVKVTFGKMQRQGQRYVDRKVKALAASGINVRGEVLQGNPAEAITTFAEESGADLIIMSSHGRSGPSRWAHGSVAEKVFRASCLPLLMVRAPGCEVGF